MEWLDAHSAGVQAIATLVLVVITGYYAWTSRALVRETRVTLRATARSGLQGRLDRLSEIMIHDPKLFASLDTFLPKRYVVGYWARAQSTFEPAFRRFVDERLRLAAPQ